MDLIVINLCSTGREANEGSLAFVGALRIVAETGIVSASLMTYVRPEPDDLQMFIEGAGIENADIVGLDCLPSARDALTELARFIGENEVIYCYANCELPLIRHHCECLGIPTREVRFVSAKAWARELLGGKIRLSLRILALHFLLPEADAPAPYGPLRYLRILGQVVHELWWMLNWPADALPSVAEGADMPGRVPMIPSTSL